MQWRNLPRGGDGQERLRRFRYRFQECLRWPRLGQGRKAWARAERGVARLLSRWRQGLRDPHLFLRRQDLISADSTAQKVTLSCREWRNQNSNFAPLDRAAVLHYL